MSLVDVGKIRAKSVKAAMKSADAGKNPRKSSNKSKRPSRLPPSRTSEMEELFQTDMSEKKQKRVLQGGGKKKSSFKSKSRYASE